MDPAYFLKNLYCVLLNNLRTFKAKYEKVRFCYILTAIFVTSFELVLAVFSHGYYFQFNIMGKWNHKELVYVKIMLVLVAN